MPHFFGADAGADALWQQFLETPLLNHKQRSELLRHTVAPEQLLARSPSEVLGIDAKVTVALQAALTAPCHRPWRLDRQALPVGLVHLGEPDYPPLLARCDDAPPVLFFVGNVDCLGSLCFAVVGTRTPSRDGARAAFDLAAELGDLGFTIVSGLARGIDGQAHAGALSVRAPTVAVMATGIDRVYPRSHAGLAAEIAANGVLITEFLPGMDPARWHFPRRNRTLSGLCLGTLVIEAGRPSGSLITATAAAEQGRDVFALPWSIYHKGGEGCRYLLNDGAHLVHNATDVVLTLGGEAAADPRPRKSTPSQMPADAADSPVDAVAAAADLGDDDRDASLLEWLGDAELGVPELARLSGWDTPTLLRELSRLELTGEIISTPLGFRMGHPRR